VSAFYPRLVELYLDRVGITSAAGLESVNNVRYHADRMLHSSSPARHILLVEDNPADANLALIVLEQTKSCSWMDVVSSGDDALRYLRGDGDYASKSKPDVILMDMMLPMKSGLEMIQYIRSVPGCEVMPIVIVSGNENPVSLRQAYDLGANCVISKPSRWEEYFEKLEVCYKFWCGVAQLPPPSNGVVHPS
jgi:chemotaxis family two-component system response regulator Rcp1